MNTTMTRQTNLRMLIEQQEKVQEMTFDEQLPDQGQDADDDAGFLSNKLRKDAGLDNPSQSIYSKRE